MELKIFRAAEAFLYLPAYIAYEYQIFETLIKSLKLPFEVKIVFEKASNKGDIGAIKDMLRENRKDHDSIAIAIADPSAILSNNLRRNLPSDCRVIGAIIDKLPFWGINHIDKKFSSLDDFQDHFRTVIHYDGKLVTGSHLGKKLISRYQNLSGHEVSFGKEIETLELLNNPSSNKEGKAVAISADILAVVKAVNREESPLKINFNFSQNGNYLTTGLITTKDVCEKQGAILSKVIEAIQKSIAIIYSSEKIASNVLESILKNKNQFSKNESIELSNYEIKKMIDLINDEEFYPSNMKVTEEGWKKAILAIGETEVWGNERIDKALEDSYSIYIDNQFVSASEKTIAKQFGISKDTFNDEISSIVDPLSEVLGKLKKENEDFSIELRDKETELGKLNKTLVSKETDLKSKTDKLDLTIQKVSQLEDSLSDISTQLNTKVVEYETTNTELIALATEHTDVKDKFEKLSKSLLYIPYFFSWLFLPIRKVSNLISNPLIYAILFTVIEIALIIWAYFIDKNGDQINFLHRVSYSVLPPVCLFFWGLWINRR